MKTVEVPLWPTAHERNAIALERIAKALEAIAEIIKPEPPKQPQQPWILPEEEAAFLKSVGDYTP